MKEKPVGRFEGTLQGVLLKTQFGVMLSNWLAQGMLYMNWYERFLKLAINLVLVILPLWAIGLPFTPTILVAAFLLAHTLNWVFNGHFFVLMRYVRPFPKTEEEFQSFVGKLKIWGVESKCVNAIAIYGSYCRNRLHENSDLDVRVIVEKGLMNSICGAIFCAVARWRAFFATFPLDIYLSVAGAGLEKLRDDENPVIIVDKTSELSKHYGN